MLVLGDPRLFSGEVIFLDCAPLSPQSCYATIDRSPLGPRTGDKGGRQPAHAPPCEVADRLTCHCGSGRPAHVPPWEGEASTRAAMGGRRTRCRP
jgi:hypothetical protein